MIGIYRAKIICKPIFQSSFIYCRKLHICTTNINKNVNFFIYNRRNLSNALDNNKNDSDISIDNVNNQVESSDVKNYIGVHYFPNKIKKYKAIFEFEDTKVEVDGGDFWTAEDAAKAYDELAQLYIGDDAKRNFNTVSNESNKKLDRFVQKSNQSVDISSNNNDWIAPGTDKIDKIDIIPIRKGEYLTTDEIVTVLKKEKAMDIRVMDLNGKTNLAQFMIFCTCRTKKHMQNMADMLIDSINARDIVDDFEYSVEGRDCDDWMVTDLNNIIVNFFDKDARRLLRLEEHWENMKNNQSIEMQKLSSDEYMDKYGIAEICEEDIVPETIINNEFVDDKNLKNRDSKISSVSWK